MFNLDTFLHETVYYKVLQNTKPPIFTSNIADSVLDYLDSHKYVSVKDRIFMEIATDSRAIQVTNCRDS